MFIILMLQQQGWILSTFNFFFYYFFLPLNFELQRFETALLEKPETQTVSSDAHE